MAVYLPRLAILSALLLGQVSAAQAQVVVLTASGEMRDGLAVVQPHPAPETTHAVLTRGYSGRLLRLYAREQEYLRRKTGRSPEPAYLVLSNRQGGFPRYGFYLDGQKKPDVGWVDLHRGSRLSGRFGAVDQIFPHELLHVIVRQLAGVPRQSHGNQIHAIGVRTDSVIAFNEGFAEHAQIMAVDDPDALEETAMLPGQADSRERADREIAAYARDLARRWWPIEPSRLRFLLWFGHAEQVQRYFAVKANLFARTPPIPGTLLSDPYRAYLFQSVVPGAVDDAPKPAGVVLATDGGVAHLFWRLVTDPALQQRYRADDFYAEFGTARGAVTPLENVYLKIFAMLYEGRPSTAAEALRAWALVHPEDGADVARIARAVLGQDPPDVHEIWLANEALITGTSLFDQYRALPRSHTFDANAAVPLDWLAVPGVGTEVAARLIADAPYENLDALLDSPALSPPLRARVAAMSRAVSQVTGGRQNDGDTLSLWAIARSYLWRLGALVLLATVTGAWLTRLAGVRRYTTAALMAFAATAMVVALAWVITSPPWYPMAAPVVLGGAPWAGWQLAHRRGMRHVARALGAWVLAAVPALVLTAAW
ncbi:MAG TPA: hypothetical protein VM493_08530 [Vicinamibacterales bacterium]|nr:hypothetical protein [Vicinamibacterales bacterium]